jgi:uncharacterized damage-inducible protein DinB
MKEAIRQSLSGLLDGAKAHTTFEKVTESMPVALRGVVPKGLPYSAWQIVEHMRLAQKDMLNFCSNRDGEYKPMKWPDDYWPKQTEPPTSSAWDEAVQAVQDDRAAFVQLLEEVDDEGLVAPFSWDHGQTLLQEAMQIAEHASYHVGELVVVRRLLGAWG